MRHSIGNWRITLTMAVTAGVLVTGLYELLGHVRPGLREGLLGPTYRALSRIDPAYFSRRSWHEELLLFNALVYTLGVWLLLVALSAARWLVAKFRTQAKM